MAQLSNHQILNHAYIAGWRDSDDLVRVLSIALAESGGNTDAVSPTGCCHGLMQINVRVHKQYTVAQMRDPQQNMNAAFALWRASGWRPWDSSRGGQLLKRPEAVASATTWQVSPGVGAQGTGGAVTEAAGALTQMAPIIDAGNRVVQWVTTPANIGRVVMVVAGSILVVAALIRIAPIPTPMTIAKVLK